MFQLNCFKNKINENLDNSEYGTTDFFYYKEFQFINMGRKKFINLTQILNIKPMNRTQSITFKGKSIFFMDYTGLKSEVEIKAVIEEAKLFIRKQPLGSTISLANIDQMHFNNQIKDLFMDLVKGNKPYMKASAIVGVSGLKQILFNGIMKMTGRDVKSFNDENQAKEWLIAQN